MCIFEGRTILFIVPTRALVQQQANYIKKHTAVLACTVEELCGIAMEQWTADRYVAVCVAMCVAVCFYLHGGTAV